MALQVKSTLQVNFETYFAIIKGLFKSKQIYLALDYYESINLRNLVNNEEIFNMLIDACYNTNNPYQLKNIYSHMLPLDIENTLLKFNTMIDVYIREGYVSSA